ncbi:hypothetical protein NE237_003497 [Protea cynaroides]|uniref:Uncharacterized protein n=1 Tax=Protea cynaroides TaxID=273540 RepID=A0A9Q0KGU6_9MAGN|nr:hypothetical protein NE237_003497 [Protea cynaroides]
MSPAGGSLISALGKGRGTVNNGYGRGSSCISLDYGVERIGVEAFEERRSGSLSTTDMAAMVKKTVTNALATIFPSLVSDAMNQAGNRVLNLPVKVLLILDLVY